MFVISRLGQRIDAVVPQDVLPGIVETIAQALKCPMSLLRSSMGKHSVSQPPTANRMKKINLSRYRCSLSMNKSDH